MIFRLDKTSCILHQRRLFLRGLMWFRYVVVGVSGVLSIRFKDRSSTSVVMSSADPLPSTRTKETIQCPSPYWQPLHTHPFQPLDMAEGFQCSLVQILDGIYIVTHTPTSWRQVTDPTPKCVPTMQIDNGYNGPFYIVIHAVRTELSNQHPLLTHHTDKDLD